MDFPPPGYTDTDAERWAVEPPKQSSTRTPFMRDRARIVHAASLRRLGAKTQILGAGSGDFVRTRLTHTLEVAQIGRELGAALGCDPDVVDAACLAHDLGHPPFGHNGERALDEIAKDIGGFEGNAQTFRVLTRLEPKSVDPTTGASVGLNLTRASLDAAIKYPWRESAAPDRPDGTPSRKFGVYEDDRPIFDWVRNALPSGGTRDRAQSFEAQVMDMADDISYSVHDVEDSVVHRQLSLGILRDAGQARDVFDHARAWYGRGEQDELAAALTRLQAEPNWPDEYDGSHGALARLKDFTSQLIGRFCSAAIDATVAAHGAGPHTRHSADLVVPADTLSEILLLKGIAVHFLMAPREESQTYRRQRSRIEELVHAIAERGDEALDSHFVPAWRDAADDAARMRVAIDQVASLTDKSAYDWHHKWVGSPSSSTRNGN